MLFFYFVDGNRNLNEIRAKFMIKAEDFIRVLFKLLSNCTQSVRFETKALSFNKLLAHGIWKRGFRIVEFVLE